MTERLTEKSLFQPEFLYPRYWPTWLGMGLLRLLSLFPLGALFAIGKLLGRVLHRILIERRRIATINVSRCFPDQSHQAVADIVRDTFEVIATVALAGGVTWWASHERLSRLVRVHQSQHFTEALKNKQPIILLAPHFCAVDTAGIYLSSQHPGVSIFQRSRNRLLDAFVLRGHQRFGAQLFERKGGMRSLIRAVRNGASLYYLPDQDPGPRRAVFAPFFGVQTASWPVLGRVAGLIDATVIPCVCRLNRTEAGYDIHFEAPLKDFPTGDALTDAARMNAVVEAQIKETPSQYFWVHKRFKTRPAGEEDFYR